MYTEYWDTPDLPAEDHRYNPAPFCAKCGGPCEMIDHLPIFCDGCGAGLAPGENCEACELSQLYLVTRSVVRVLFWTALAAVAGLSTALLYAWINPHA